LKIDFSKKTQDLFEKATPKVRLQLRIRGSVANSKNRY
jgi:hypothetical protein